MAKTLGTQPKNKAQIILDYDPKQALLSSKDDPLSISPHSILDPVPFLGPSSLLAAYIAQGGETKGYLFIKKIYDILQERVKDGSDAAFNLLLQYLPLLSNIEAFGEPADFAQWFFDEKDGSFRAEAFDYLFRRVEEIARVYPDKNISLFSDNKGYDTRTDIIAKSLNHYFDPTHNTAHMPMRSSGKAFQAIHCCQHYAKILAAPPTALGNQLLYVLLNNDHTIEQETRKNLFEQVRYWQRRLALTQLGFNNLTEIYQKRGSAGLKQLFDLWKCWEAIKLPVASSNPSGEEDLLARLYRISFKSCHTYLPLLELKHDTIEQIQKFYLTPEVADFWETLLTQHYEVVADDDLSKLANSFQAFRDRLTSLLGSDVAKTLPTLQYPIKSLPVALSRILSLLEHCRPEDRLKQWECIGSLDFSSKGVPQAILHNYLFVLPEMGKESIDNKETVRRYIFIPHVPHGVDSSSWNTANRLISFFREESANASLQATKDKSCVVTDEQDINSLRAHFFEYIAAQSSALPLCFYQEAENAILVESRHPILLVNLYRYLAVSTTNDAALYSANHTDLLKSWEKFVNNFAQLTSSMIHRLPEAAQDEARRKGCAPGKAQVNLTALARTASSALEELLGKSISACMGLSLPIFLKIMDHVANILQDEKLISPESIHRTLNQIKQALDDMATAAQSYQGVYLGLYNPFESNQKTTDNDKDISFLFNYCKTLEAIRNNKKIDDSTKSKLISLIATFQLKPYDITNIIDKIDSINAAQKKFRGDVVETIDYASVRLLDFLVTLLLLKSVGNKEGRLSCLTLNHLSTLLNALLKNISTNNNASDIRDLLCRLIHDHLPVGCYDNTCLQQLFDGKQGLSLHLGLKDLIQIEFDANSQACQQVERFLEQCLLNPADVNRIRNIFNTVLELYRSLEKEPETQKNLLADLAYIAQTSDKKSVEKLYPLLHRISRVNTTALDFIHFIRRIKERNNNDADNLHQRLSDYLDSMTQLRKQKLPVSVIERFSRLFEQLLLDTQKKTSFVQLKSLQDDTLKLIGADSHVVGPLFDILSSLNFTTDILSFLQYFTHCVTLLENSSHDNASTITIRRDLLQYGQKKPEILSICLKNIDEQLTQDTSKVDLLHLLSIFLRQETTFNNEAFDTLRGYFKAEEAKSDNILKTVIACYKTPPYMPLDKLISALNEHRETFQAIYDAFSKEPHAREKSNCFHLNFAIEQKDRFTAVDLSEANINKLSEKINEVKASSMDALRRQLSQLKQKAAKEDLSMDERLQLIACLAELLYRSNSTSKDSFELNTTQYLTILAMLSSKGRAMTEIATGEGKSRIMMLLAASQYILGKTTDFVSSDFALAKRDYLAYSPFFLALDAKIRLISADSPINDYETNAIHFSDTTQLSHFRNRARVSRELAIDPDESKRSLLMDEVDATLYDKAQTRFNYSSPDKSMQDMAWIYLLLVKFVLGKNEGQSLNGFINFVVASKISSEQGRQLDCIDDSQLQTWLESAYKATQLKLNQHFVIKPNQRHVTPTGAVTTKSAVFVLHENRVYPDSRYSSGVHECLEAFLEIKRCDVKKQEEDSQELRDILAQCKTPFSPKAEVRILCSSNTYDLFHAYQSGNLFGVTGTLGSTLEKEEVSALYDDFDRPTQFINVPRHQKLQRIDRPIRLVANSNRQVQLLMEYIQAAYAKKQPVLLISKNPEKSNELFQAINAINENQPKDKRIPGNCFQQIPCDLPPEKESIAIWKAGEAKMITFGTTILGRGVDISLQDDAKKKGLLVLLDYLPSSKRDYYQIVGRSGRYGALGETRLVVTRDDISFNYYLNSERWKEEKWEEAAKKTQSKRALEFLLSTIYTKLQNKFSFNYNYFNQWSEFIKKYRESYLEVKAKIIGLFKLREDQKISNLIKAHEQTVGKVYQDQIPSDGPTMGSVANSQDNAQEEIETFLLNQKTVSNSKANTRFVAYKSYDPALDGRSKIYTRLFAETRASVGGGRSFFANTRAALRGEGILFADTRATLHGERPLFANIRTALINKH